MKNKSKKIIKIALALLLVVLVQTIGITYAKYISEERGTGEASVAGWAFKMTKNETETKNVELINTVNKSTLVNGKIAPGTSGLIELKIDATGAEVGMDYAINFANEKNKPQNIVFTYNDNTYKSLSEIDDITGNIPYYDAEKFEIVLIEWKWEYETGNTKDLISYNDEIDTQDGIALLNYTFDIIATGTQSR